MQVLLLLAGSSSLGAIITTVTTFLREHRGKGATGKANGPVLAGPMQITITDHQGNTVNFQADGTSEEAQVEKLVKNLREKN
jgi:hypothetical protein